MTTSEEIQYFAVQKRSAVYLSLDCVVLTNKKVIFYKPKTFGLKMEFENYTIKDVSDFNMKEEMFGADFRIRSVYSKISTINFLPKAQTSLLYQMGQEKEEEQGEIRRQRELEDKRAITGGVTLSNSVPTQSAESAHKLKIFLGN